jgi:ABC-type polysaccharide/polyol phosphate export permease
MIRLAEALGPDKRDGATGTTLVSCARLGWSEIASGVRNWRVWHLMGSSELRRRYARSRLGQLWLTLSTGLSIAVLGAVWAILWGVSLQEMMIYIAIGQVLWLFIAGSLTDATQAFVAQSHLFHNQYLPFSTAAFANVYKQLLILAHNFAVIVIVAVIFHGEIGWHTLLFLPALVLTVVTALWMTFTMALLCAR